MNRYNPVHEDAMVADENGTHVRYEDHAAAIAAERAKFAAFADENARLRSVLDGFPHPSVQGTMSEYGIRVLAWSRSLDAALTADFTKQAAEAAKGQSST